MEQFLDYFVPENYKLDLQIDKNVYFEYELTCDDGNFIYSIVDELKLSQTKTKDLLDKMNKMGLDSTLFVGGAELDKNFSLAARNIFNVDVLPQQGANVYDILRRDTLVLTKEAVEKLEGRLA